jgi:hypothetical protein
MRRIRASSTDLRVAVLEMLSNGVEKLLDVRLEQREDAWSSRRTPRARASAVGKKLSRQ